MRANMIIEKGATDRRLVHILNWLKITVQFAGWGGYFCVLLLSLPNVYPAQKQVMPKLTTAMKSTILIG